MRIIPAHANGYGREAFARDARFSNVAVINMGCSSHRDSDEFHDRCPGNNCGYIGTTRTARTEPNNLALGVLMENLARRATYPEIARSLDHLIPDNYVTGDFRLAQTWRLAAARLARRSFDEED